MLLFVVLQLYYRETQAQVFSFGLWEIFQNSVFYRILPLDRFLYVSGLHWLCILDKQGNLSIIKYIEEFITHTYFFWLMTHYHQNYWAFLTRKVTKLKLKVLGRQGRNSHLELFYKKGVFKNFGKFSGKRPSQSLFFHKVAAWGLKLYLKRDSGIGLFLWVLWNSQETSIL